MTDESRRLLVFFLKGEEYALDLKDVVEVVEPPAVFPIPRAPAHFIGAMNFHGALVPVLDLAHYTETGVSTPDGKVLVLDGLIATLALWVDGIKTIIPADTFDSEKPSTDILTDKVLVGSEGELRLLALDPLVKRLEQSINVETR